MVTKYENLENELKQQQKAVNTSNCDQYSVEITMPKIVFLLQR